MKRELKKKIRKLCEDADSAAASARLEEITDAMEREFDMRVDAGMSELDAYRDVLKNVAEIQRIFDELPRTEQEIRRKERRASFSTLKGMLDSTSSCLWIGTTILYFLVSIAFGGWKYTWLLFLWGAIGQNLLDLVKDYNAAKKPQSKILNGHLSGILWLLLVIVYFVFSLATGRWALTWLLFPFGAILQIILDSACQNADS